MGTWLLNVARSWLGPGSAPRSIVSTIETVAGGVRTEAKFTARMDSKDDPIQGSANADTITLRRVDAQTIERVDQRAGTVVETSTNTGKGNPGRCEAFEYAAIHEKPSR